MTVAHSSALSDRLHSQTSRLAGVRLGWFRAGSVWVAHVDHSVCGIIQRHGLAYRASNELGDPVGVFLTLRAAKDSLQRSQQTALRHEMRTGHSHLSGTLAFGLVVVGGVAGTLLLQAPL